MTVKVKVTQSCLTLCNHMNYTVHGILQARILEWVAIPFSKGSSQPRVQTQVSCISGRFFTVWTTREPIGLSGTCSQQHPSWNNCLKRLCRLCCFLFVHIFPLDSKYHETEVHVSSYSLLHLQPLGTVPDLWYILKTIKLLVPSHIK